ncbi:MAG: CCA tRNA nucleotidyltransferase [Proteobacteria bacterium]|nr:CCA tRNA nucleotidyltransferase [Pseudomonadota bacterium]
MTRLVSSWLHLPALQQLFDIFEREGATLRLVGGSVRDGLLGLPVSDIDLAVDRDPHWVMNLLHKAHIKAIPTGIDHGTITAVLEKRPYQITTLRVDVKTFGRKAHVAFTEDWLQDAMRRDFTMNAIYADKHGHLFDPVKGLEDLESHYVRFIGNAAQRIKEDYLRILRFFRFSARFGHEPYDAEGMNACREYASHLPHLARERVTEEFLKILELPLPLYALEAMKETDVLSYILHPGTWDDLKALVPLEKEVGFSPSALLRLAAFHPILVEIKAHLRLSKKQETILAFLGKKHELITETSFKHQAYLWGKEKIFDLILLQTARRIVNTELNFNEGVSFIKHLHFQFESWLTPVFPLTGDDLLSCGIRQGENIGIFLKTVENWWISQDFEPDRDACLGHLRTLL